MPTRKTADPDENAAVVCADIRISLSAEIARTRALIEEETTPDEEGAIRAKLAGLEWALSDVLRLMTFHQLSG